MFKKIIKFIKASIKSFIVIVVIFIIFFIIFPAFLPFAILRWIFIGIKKINNLFPSFLLVCFFILIFAVITAILALSISGYLYLYSEHWLPIYDFYESSLEAQEKKANPVPSKIFELHDFFGQFARNSGWIVWMGISLFGLFLTLILTIWGRIIQLGQRKTQHTSHLHDRYEKAANMLGSEVMAVRVAGCRALMGLGKDDRNMKEQCVRLLLSFMNNPYLETEDKEIYKNKIKELSQDEVFEIIFPYDRPLRADIQEAADSCSAIYEHYSDAKTNKEEVILPHYFLQNEKKKSITLIKANLTRLDYERIYLLNANLRGTNLKDVQIRGINFEMAILEKANLEGANMNDAYLRKANFKSSKLINASFDEANLRRTNFRGADISFAYLETAKDLTKEQILSAKWGYDKQGEGKPSLPQELKNDSEVQKWLEKPHYDKRKIIINLLLIARYSLVLFFRPQSSHTYHTESD